MTKTILKKGKKKKIKKAKWLSREDLKVAEKRNKGERERNTQLNAAFQRIARRDTKALNEQCKGIEENNRMGTFKDLFKKIGYTKGIFHAKMGTTKDRNGKELTKAEEIKNRWQKYTELHKKIS